MILDYLKAPFIKNKKSLRQILDILKTGRVDKALLKLVNRLANMTYPLGLEEGYDKAREKHGDENFMGSGALVAWWRELWHLVGGMAVAYYPLAYGISPQIVIPSVLLAIIYVEHKDQSGSHPKRIVDISFWTYGASLMALICS